jgi:hypothetical protein
MLQELIKLSCINRIYIINAIYMIPKRLAELVISR